MSPRRLLAQTLVAAVLLAAWPASAPAQQSSAATTTAAAPRPVTARDRRRAAALYLRASRNFQKAQFARAQQQYEQAAALVSDNPDYALAAGVARSHYVQALLQQAARDRLRGDAAAAQAALQQARLLDPESAQVQQHFQGPAADADLQSGSLYGQASSQLAATPVLQPTAGLRSFHLRATRPQLIQQVFHAYGIQATLDPGLSAINVRLDIDNVTFSQVLRALSLVTRSFWVPLDAHRVFVARDTPENRRQYERQELETVYLPGLNKDERTAIGNLAKNLFQTSNAVVQQGLGTLTVRAPTRTLDDFNATLRDLLQGRSQVMLDVRLIQLAHTNVRNTGLNLPQQITAFNVYAEEQSILNANQALVQQIIASGLAAPGDTLAILGILLASGQVSSSLFSSGIALFGGGLTLSGLSPGSVSANLNLNSSASRELDQIQLRLANDESGTVRSGLRYPIMTSSFSNLGGNTLNIPGLTSAGNSSDLSSILASLAGAATQIPQVEYQDLGLTLKATPDVMRNGDVALTLDMKLTALAGSSVNGVPVLNNRSYSGVVTLKEGSAFVIMSELDQQEARALSGTPGLSEIPGLNNISARDTEKDYATLLLIITPHVIRDPHPAGRSPMLRIDRSTPR